MFTRSRFMMMSLGAGLCAFALLAPSQAKADHRHVRVVRPAHGPIWAPPVYESRERIITVPAVYENRERQVWHEPVYENRRVLVEEPAEVVHERVPRYDRKGRFQGYHTVERVVRPARRYWKEDQVVVTPGHFETIVERVLIQPERQEVAFDRVLVRPGRWEYPNVHRDVVVTRTRPAPVVVGTNRYYSRGGFGIQGHYRDKDDWGFSLEIGK